MIEVCWLVLGIMLVAGLLYLGLRITRAFEMWVRNGRGQEVFTTSGVPRPTQGQLSQEREEPQVNKFKAPELPPETIAPGLKNPPKSPGFGRSNH